MTNEEIVKSFVESKDKAKQVKIIADLTGFDQMKVQSIIITQLTKRTPVQSVMDIIFGRLSDIEDMTADLEREHRELTAALNVLAKLEGEPNGKTTLAK